MTPVARLPFVSSSASFASPEIPRFSVVASAPVVGMVGAGQLARMTHQAAIALGVHLRLLAVGPKDCAAAVCADVHFGEPWDDDAVARFAQAVDVLTFDHEHVPAALVAELERRGVIARPGSHALPFVQDKLRMRERLAEARFPVPRWAVPRPGHERDDVVAFAEEHGWPVVVKAISGGYDGKGVWVVADPPGVADVVEKLSGIRWFVEQHVDFRREVAIQVARSANGETRSWPVVQTVQENGICTFVVAPAPGIDPVLAEQARGLAEDIAKELDVVGLLAVELFETDGVEPLVVNELAMRPHNSGHWTMDGSVTSQFEQHLRAILGWPLGDTELTAPVTVMANLLGGSGADAEQVHRRIPAALADPGVKIHLYNKVVKPGRKIGHVNVCGDDPETARQRAARAVGILRGEETP